METFHFLESLALVLCVAAVTTVIFQRLHQPVVLGYVLAGLLIGPHVPIPLVGDPEVVHTLSELGVILLMFSLGLEFSLRKLLRVGPAGLTAIIETSFMAWLGFVAGRLFGWSVMESVFAGGCVAISSTTIIAKVFDEDGIRGKLRDLVVGILVVEDLIAILFLTTLTAVASGVEASADTLLHTTLRLAAFLTILLAVGIFTIPRAFRAIVKLNRPETTVVASAGLCFGVALLAQRFGYSVALGAFIAGALVAESGEEEKIEPVIRPVRDLLASVFFVSVGMLIDPALIARHWIAVLGLTAIVLGGKVIGVTIGAFLAGQGVRTAVSAGMSLAQIGEFSFIIVGLGVTLGAAGEFLYPVAVAVSSITMLTTPFLVRRSGDAARWADRKLPKRVQTIAALYGSWVESLAASRPRAATGTVRNLAGLLLLDAVLLAGVAIGMAPVANALAPRAHRAFGMDDLLARGLVVAAAAALAAPLGVGIFRTAQRLGATLAEIALPAAGEGRVDLADAPRRAFMVTLQIAIVLPVALLLLAVTQPFLRGPETVVVVVALVVALAVAFWRSATNLQGHVRAGARMIVDTLAKEARSGGAPAATAPALDRVRAFLPGLGDPVAVTIAPDSPSVGKTLAELDLRGRTGATVLAIVRGAEGVIVPTAQEALCEGDCLALTGTHEAVDAARGLLLERRTADRTAS